MNFSQNVLTLAIPNRNGARFLGETLESLRENHPYVRWWLQDAVSNDSSISIAREHATSDDRIVIEQDSGQADALNRAFSKMGGEIIGFINSDDRLKEGAAQAVLEEFEKDNELELVFGEMELIDVSGNIVGYHSGAISSLAEVLDVYRFWWNRRQWIQPEVFWRRSLWNRVGLFNARYDLAFDYEYWVRCFQAGAKVKAIPRTLAQFRRHPAQKSNRTQDAANEIRNIVSDALASTSAIDARHRKRLERMISYDRYQSGQDYPHGTERPSFGSMLLRKPTWALLPPVRQRIVRSALRTFQK